MPTLTPTEQQARGGQSLVGGGFRNAAPPQFAAPAPTPTSTPTRTTPTTTAAPTTSGVLTPDQQARLQDITTQAQALEQQVNSLADQEPTAGQILEDVGGGLDAGPSYTDIYGEEEDDDAITDNQMKLFQQEIDATNQVFDQMLNEARLEGTGRLGSQRATAARGGLLGSDFAGAQKKKVQGFNADIREGIQAERTAAIGAIMGNVRSAVQDEKREKRLARQQGAENYLSFLANKDQRDAQNSQLIASDLINLGIDPQTLSPEELQTITQEAGIAPESVLRTYRQLQAEQEAAAAESGANEFGFMSTSGGVFRTNPQTGEAEFIASPGAASGGGSSGGPSIKSGRLITDEGEIADLQNDFVKSRGENGKISGEIYNTALTNWRNLGGLEDDFYKYFPPKDWLSASDDTVPPSISSQIKTSGSGVFTIGGVPVDLSSGAGEETEISDDGTITGDDSPWWNFWD